MKKQLILAMALIPGMALVAEAIESADALAEVRAAADSGDASDISIEDINAIDGISGAEATYLEDYQSIIASEINPEDTDADLIEALQEFIDAIGSTPDDVTEQIFVSNLVELWPDSRYTVNNNGTVTDNISGLMWQQCSAGQTLTEGDDVCTEPEDENDLLFNWKSALEHAQTTNAGVGYAGYTDWRLPNISELGSLIARNRYLPAANSSAMPYLLTDWYWTSSPDFNDGTKSWQVNLQDGSDFTEQRSETAHVILVRNIQSQ